MKKILFILSLSILFVINGLNVFASSNEEALNFFKSYVSASNSYSPKLLTMYSNNAKIVRQVVKPDGTLVNVPFSMSVYKTQMKLGSAGAKIKNYKNYYSDIQVAKVANGYKISAKRKPSMSDYKLNSIMVVQKQSNGNWLIVEETMQTKEQIFLKYAK